MHKVSILIPVCDAGRYIARCLDSIFDQTYENIEVILVNDGAEYATFERIRKYLSLDRFQYIEQESCGMACTKNQCLKEAEGDYFLYVNPSDWLERDAVRSLVDVLEQDKLDAVLGRYGVEHGEKEHLEERLYADRLYPNAVITGAEFMRERLEMEKPDLASWQGMFRRELVKQHGGYFTPGVFCEEAEWLPKLMVFFRRMKEIPKLFCHHMEVENPLRNQEEKRKCMEDLACMGLDLVRFYKRHIPSQEERNLFCDFAVRSYICRASRLGLDWNYGKELLGTTWFMESAFLPQTKQMVKGICRI